MKDTAVVACRKCQGIGIVRLPRHLDRDGNIPRGQLTIVCRACGGLGSRVVKLPQLTADDHRLARQQLDIERKELLEED
jgi:hypothetical protein